MRRSLVSTAVVALLMLPGAALANDLTTFGKGSLIIPVQANFQTDCGAISAYGLVWRLLYANDTYFWPVKNKRITVYLAVDDTKASPNRCTPSNLNTDPSTSPNLSSTSWKDGCDVTIQAPPDGGVPVSPVPIVANKPDLWPASGLYPVANIPNYASGTFASPAGTEQPAYAAVTMSLGNGFDTIRYMGAPFIIDASDAQDVIEFMRLGSGATGTCTSGSLPGTCGYDVQLQQFMNTAGTNTCPNNGCQISGTHLVNIHQTRYEFSARVARRINRVPPKVALLESDFSGLTKKVSGGILPLYLGNAGLNFGGAGGCAPNNTSGCAGATGVIYDKLDVKDLRDGVLNQTGDGGTPLYKVFWAPHWESDATTPVSVMNNIVTFTNLKGNGLLAECASLGTYEGESGGTTQVTSATSFQFTNQIKITGLTGGSSWNGKNCTDPDYASNGGECVIFPNPADPFMQVGDFHYGSVSGHVPYYRPASGTYQPGIGRLAVSWLNYAPDPAHSASLIDFITNGNQKDGASNNWDFFSVINKDNNPKKATIVYLSGHDLSCSTAGNRIVLNTLMNLGADPITQERSLSTAVADGKTVLMGTYDVITGLNPSDNTLGNYNGHDHPERFIFPLMPGHLRAHDIDQMSLGTSGLTDSTLWDAHEVVTGLGGTTGGSGGAPAGRNLFTYLGGAVTSAPTANPKGLAQQGWIPENISGPILYQAPSQATNQGNNACVDVMSLGKYKKKHCKTPPCNPGGWSDEFGLQPGADGVCDLQEVAQFGNKLDPGADFGQSENGLHLGQYNNDRKYVSGLFQMVRGFCWSDSFTSGTPNWTPGDSDCSNNDQKTALGVTPNFPVMGGVVRSTPAIIPASINVKDAANKPRPTVAYVGGWDGFLHAYYVSGGAGYTGPADTLSYPNPPASNKFAKDWTTAFSTGATPPPGTELWAFIPATQIPWLASNNARVDSSPAVQDVFADFSGSGTREWHTVLVFAVGLTGNEVTAIDITNPLKPVLLWHVVGDLWQANNYPYFSAVNLTLGVDAAGNPMVGTGGVGPGTALKWEEDDALYTPPTMADPGRNTAYLFDYGDIGAVRSVSVASLRVGLLPTAAAFVATNANGFNGAEVYAIDVPSGQVLWQWEKKYSWGDNTVPHGISLYTLDSAHPVAYLGDAESHIWELSMSNGQNTNVFQGLNCNAVAPSSTLTPCKMPVFTDLTASATNRVSITTNVGLAKVPSGPPDLVATSAFVGYPNATILLAGTANGSGGALTGGSLHALVQERTYRRQTFTQAQVTTAVAAGGLTPEVAPFPRVFPAQENLFGGITISGKYAIFTTVVGNDFMSPAFDVKKLAGKAGGGTYWFDIGSTPTSGAFATQIAGRTYGTYSSAGVVVGNRGVHVVGAELGTQTVTLLAGSQATGASPNKALSVDKPPSSVLYRALQIIQRYRY